MIQCTFQRFLFDVHGSGKFSQSVRLVSFGQTRHQIPCFTSGRRHARRGRSSMDPIFSIDTSRAPSRRIVIHTAWRKSFKS